MRQDIFILTISFLLLGALLYFQKPARNLFYSGAALLSRPLRGPGRRVASFFLFFKRQSEGWEQSRSLKRENEKLKKTLASCRPLRRENRELRKALEVGLAEDFDLAGARVAFRNLEEGFFIINKGSEDGVEKERVVISPGRALIGRVERVEPGFSRVGLIVREGEKTPVKLEGEQGKAETEGRGVSLRLKFVPRKRELAPGESLTTSGSGRRTPPGLLVGEVTAVSDLDVKPFKEAEVAPAVSFGTVSTVFLVRNY